jgi:hypothetical protein
LVIAGGDDNSVTLSLLHTGNAETSDRQAATISIPDAHAASVNDVKLISQSTVPSENGAEARSVRLTFVSSGNDHRVKIWQVDVDANAETGRPMVDDIQVSNVVDRFSPVADISSVDVVQDQGETRLLVCGVGMEYFRVRL